MFYFILLSDHTTTLTLMQKSKLDKEKKNFRSEGHNLERIRNSLII